MAPKAKAKAGGGASEEMAEKWQDFFKAWKSNEKTAAEGLGAGAVIAKLPDVDPIKEKIEGGEECQTWNFTTGPVDHMAFALLWKSLRETGYKYVRAIRLWKCNNDDGDESVRSVCHFLESPACAGAVEDIQFTDIGVTALGCRFLGQALGGSTKIPGTVPNANFVPPVTYLRLDCNRIGGAGVVQLAAGLAQNKNITALSLQYCAIGENGGLPLRDILMYQQSKLEILMLRGNELQDAGVEALLSGVRRSKTLKVLDITDNKANLEQPGILALLLECFTGVLTLEKYCLGGNQLTDVGVEEVVKGVTGQAHVKEIQIPERCSAGAFTKLAEALGGGKKGKKGKKKKK